jgi:predicted PurR-regulated permease PerM
MKLKPEKNQITWGITIFAVAVALMIVYYMMFKSASAIAFFYKIINALSGVIIGISIAYVLIPVLDAIETKLLKPLYVKKGIDVSFAQEANWNKRRQMRAIAVAITMFVFVFMLYSLFSSILPQLISSIREISFNLPIYIRNLDYYANSLVENNPELQELIDTFIKGYYETLSSYILEKLLPQMPDDKILLETVSRSFMSVVGVVLDLIVGFIVAIYILNSKERFTTRGKKIAYSLFKEDFANELVGGFRFANKTFKGFIGGKLLDSIIIGIICYIGCLLLKINYPVLISVIVGVTNIIPYFGPYIGGIAGALLLVMINPMKALVFLIFVIVLQQFDGNILGPRILGGSTGLSSFWVIFSITFFGGMWGIIGLLLGVPIFAVIYAFFARLTNHFLAKKKLSTLTGDYYDLAYIENHEYKLLSDPSNTKFHAAKGESSFRNLFKKRVSNTEHMTPRKTEKTENNKREDNNQST